MGASGVTRVVARASREVKCLAPPRERRDWLCGGFVFVERTAEPVVTAEAIELQLFCTRCRFSYRRWLRERRPLAERAVGVGCNYSIFLQTNHIRGRA